MVSNYEVAKKFAEGKERATGSNMYIDGDTVYSYGSHFPIATRWNKDGIDYLYNPERYSNSTGKHQSYVRGCISKYTVLEVSYCEISNAQEQKKANLKEIELLKGKIDRARSDNYKRVYKRDIKHLKEQNDLLDKYITQTE